MSPADSHPPVATRPLSIDVGAARVAMHVAGQGVPLLLFHSLLADRSSFDRVLPALAGAHTVYALDLPGFGGSDFVDGGLEAVADRVAAAVGALQLPAKPVLLGNGYGGFVALLVAIRHPQLAARLVLADCGACFSEPGRAAFRGMSAGAQKSGLAAVADTAMRRLFAPAYQAEHPDLIAERKQRFLALEPRTFHAACAALAELDLRPQLAGVTLPTLVTVGEMDEATPPPMSHELAAGLPNAQLHLLPGLAHVPQLQAPAQFLQVVEPFLRAAA